MFYENNNNNNNYKKNRRLTIFIMCMVTSAPAKNKTCEIDTTLQRNFKNEKKKLEIL
jgi:hypothetical protein